MVLTVPSWSALQDCHSGCEGAWPFPMSTWGRWLLLLMKVVGGAGWWPQESKGPGKTPRVNYEEAERKKEQSVPSGVGQPRACSPWHLALIKTIVRLGCLLKQKSRTLRNHDRLKSSGDRAELLVFVSDTSWLRNSNQASVQKSTSSSQPHSSQTPNASHVLGGCLLLPREGRETSVSRFYLEK